MRKTLLSLATGTSLICGTLAAQAMPAGALAGETNPDVILVAGGCGPGFHRGPFGGCRPNFYGRPYGRPFYRGGYYRHY